jgi:hypothetical protein
MLLGDDHAYHRYDEDGDGGSPERPAQLGHAPRPPGAKPHADGQGNDRDE